MIDDSANFAQKTFGNKFSDGGKFAGQTIDDVANTLQRGDLTHGQRALWEGMATCVRLGEAYGDTAFCRDELGLKSAWYQPMIFHISGPFSNSEDFWCSLEAHIRDDYTTDLDADVHLSGPFQTHAELREGSAWHESSTMRQRVADWFRQMSLDPEIAFPDGVEVPSPLSPPYSWWNILSHVSESFRYVPPF